jgi:uncharacterized protein (TIGR02246 family)
MISITVRKTATWLLGAALCTAYACAPAPAPMQGTAEDEAAIRAIPGKYTTAFNANDTATMASLVAEDFENVTAAGTHTQGRAAFRQLEERSLTERAVSGLTLTLSAPSTYLNWIDARHAVMGGTWSMSGVPAGAPDKGAWMVVVEKSADGQWLMTNSLVADAPMAPPATPEKK